MDLPLRKAFVGNPKKIRDSSLQITRRGYEGKLSNGCSKRRVSGVVVTRMTRWSVRGIKVMGEIYYCGGVKLPSHTMTKTFFFFAEVQITWCLILGVPFFGAQYPKISHADLARNFSCIIEFKRIRVLNYRYLKQVLLIKSKTIRIP